MPESDGPDPDPSSTSSPAEELQSLRCLLPRRKQSGTAIYQGLRPNLGCPVASELTCPISSSPHTTPVCHRPVRRSSHTHRATRPAPIWASSPAPSTSRSPSPRLSARWSVGIRRRFEPGHTKDPSRDSTESHGSRPIAISVLSRPVISPRAKEEIDRSRRGNSILSQKGQKAPSSHRHSARLVHFSLPGRVGPFLIQSQSHRLSICVSPPYEQYPPLRRRLGCSLRDLLMSTGQFSQR